MGWDLGNYISSLMLLNNTKIECVGFAFVDTCWKVEHVSWGYPWLGI